MGADTKYAGAAPPAPAEKSMMDQALGVGAALFTQHASPKMVTLHDPLLGVTNRVVQAGIMVGIIMMLTVTPPIHAEPPKSHAPSYFGAPAQLRLEQEKGANGTGSLYCQSISDYDYGDAQCRATRSAGFGLFCDYNLKCADYDYAEMNIKGENEMFFMTMNKDAYTVMGACSPEFQAQCASLGTSATAGEDSSVRYADEDDWTANYDKEGEWVYLSPTSGVGTQCTCKKMDNFIARGVEGMALVMGFNFETSETFAAAGNDFQFGSHTDTVTFIHREGDQMDDVNGESMMMENVDDWVYPSCVDLDGKKRDPCKFDKTSPALRVDEWLRLAGVPLHEGSEGLGALTSQNNVGFRNAGGGLTTHGSDHLMYRISGILLEMKLFYVADMGGWGLPERKKELHVFVKDTGNWQSKGSEVHYLEYPVYNATLGAYTSGTFVDRYKRGVKFKFILDGRIRGPARRLVPSAAAPRRASGRIYPSARVGRASAQARSSPRTCSSRSPP